MIRFNTLALAAAAGSVFLSACTSEVEADIPLPDPGLAILGGGTHSADGVKMEDFLGSSHLDKPMDLAFHPSETGELWIVNQGSISMSIVADVTAENWSAQEKSDPSSDHFMVNPAGLAFGKDGRMATIHEEDETTPYTGGMEGTFMGPTLWTSDANDFDGGHASHYDMLHNSPNGVGIAWEDGNAYWVFDGYHEAISRFDFAGDHGAGGADHSDSEVLRYASGEVKYEPGVASHLAYDSVSQLLYIADSGNGRIAVLDTQSGTVGSTIGPNYDGGTQNKVKNADIWTFAENSTADLEMPSGLAFHDEMIFVVDHATSIIWAFDLDGEVVDWLDTGVESDSLMGLDFDADGRLYVVDAASDKVLRISAL
jgi:hypothetical protein